MPKLLLLVALELVFFVTLELIRMLLPELLLAELVFLIKLELDGNFLKEIVFFVFMTELVLLVIPQLGSTKLAST